MGIYKFVLLVIITLSVENAAHARESIGYNGILRCEYAIYSFTETGEAFWSSKYNPEAENQESEIHIIDDNSNAISSYKYDGTITLPFTPSNFAIKTDNEWKENGILKYDKDRKIMEIIRNDDLERYGKNSAITINGVNESKYYSQIYLKNIMLIYEISAKNNDRVLIKKYNKKYPRIRFRKGNYFSTEYKNNALKFSVFAGGSTKWTRTVPTISIDKISFFKPNGEPAGLVMREYPPEGGVRLIHYDLKADKRSLIWSLPRGDVEEMILSPDQSRVIGFIHGYGVPQITLLQGNNAAVQQALRDWAEGHELAALSLVAVGPAGRRLLLNATSVEGRSAYLLVETATGTVRPLPIRCDDGVQVRTEFLAAPSGAGFDLPYYRFTTQVPAIPDGPAPPVLVYIHGGPNSQMSPRWPIALSLAQRGWEVIAPEYRGAAGYGGPLLHAGRGNLGPILAQDVEAVLEQLHLAGRRVVLLGESLGGRIALEMINRHPERYAGVFLLSAVVDVEGAFSRQQRLGGLQTPWSEGPWMQKGSLWQPATNTPFAGPIFIHHGGEDQKAPIAQIRKAKKAMQAAGWDVCLHVAHQSGHGISTLEGYRNLEKLFACFETRLNHREMSDSCGRPLDMVDQNPDWLSPLSSFSQMPGVHPPPA
ncbi:alpha/beta fold hydrolase [Niveispirillum sp. SYP-B3756]|uniref:alpha/beta hydrolase family protein n=1 Tax=Niveispirillum sp. SYP-B3756 TaxID=2662178 RepID=UPI0012911837|nr:alpha/beta fold hydrolase [Niveispirillum sp. SYP-B3756]MQP64399.1 alpha/beta fold hydrolase [Niveispirillum sp. SYP-B3756]